MELLRVGIVRLVVSERWMNAKGGDGMIEEMMK